MLKELIIEKFGTINNFAEACSGKISRSQVYYMILDSRANPTIKKMEELAEIIGCDLRIIIDYYKSLHKYVTEENKKGE